jgi:hypothetical protein
VYVIIPKVLSAHGHFLSALSVSNDDTEIERVSE